MWNQQSHIFLWQQQKKYVPKLKIFSRWKKYYYLTNWNTVPATDVYLVLIKRFKFFDIQENLNVCETQYLLFLPFVIAYFNTIAVFWSSVTGSDESRWDPVDGVSAFLILMLMCSSAELLILL